MSALALALAPIAVMMLLAGFALAAVATYALGGLAGVVDSLPWPVSNLSNPLRQLLTYLLGFSRLIVVRAEAYLLWATQLVSIAFDSLWRAVGAGLIAIVGAINANLLAVQAILTLTTLPQIERDIPQWFKEIERDISALPNEPAFRAGGPIRLLLGWLNVVWTVLKTLGPFARAVMLPVLFVLGALWGLIETIGRITRLETVQAGLVRFVDNLDRFRQADEAAFSQLVIVVNGLLVQNRQLQVDLEQERAARVALATQTQQALQAATTRLQTQIGVVGSQLSPLLVLGVLASLSGSALQVLRKTAQCDPCGRLDTGDWSDLPDRVEALENFGP